MKNSLITLVILSLSLFSSGCHTTKPKKVYQVPQELLPPPVENITIANEANVRLPETVKAYAINRYIDPCNPKIMHERHVVYKQEESPHWKLVANSEQQALIGNTYTNSKMNYNPAILEPELALELQRQRLINASMSAQVNTLIDTSISMQDTSNLLKEQTRQLTQALQEKTDQLHELEKELSMNTEEG